MFIYSLMNGEAMDAQVFYTKPTDSRFVGLTGK